ncbi:SDR family oxidoreductase [Lutibaculum baratangense]|uniref:Dehydrogenase n=1 Tax=Lutibaculum baratangense AMV1 TaxID=631454 RepID=V4QUZ0_9HYPH|nr:SDR family oxidoreductase [Lutibaculum baratangense]ESR23567.1 dehydrogenase [Lutibaculum baratangense AMV1]
MLGRSRLRPIEKQVIVITGATSGIGLATARLAARRGARLVIAARNGAALREVAEDLQDKGARVHAVPTDVGDETGVERLAEAAIDTFGRIDSWVNDAGVPLYGYLDEISTEDHRRLFETNYWGVVHGSLAALRAMRSEGRGAIINIGSVLSDVPVPLQGAYVASKHAVRGFTDALRADIATSDPGISVTLIKPTSIATPYTEHARSYHDEAPKTPPPRYSPWLVARAILRSAERPIREIYVGGGGPALLVMQKLMPGIFDLAMRQFVKPLQLSPSRRAADFLQRDNLYGPRQDGRVRGNFPAHREHSLFTLAQMYPGASLLFGAAALGGLALGLGARRRAHDRETARSREDDRYSAVGRGAV